MGRAPATMTAARNPGGNDLLGAIRYVRKVKQKWPNAPVKRRPLKQTKTKMSYDR